MSRQKKSTTAAMRERSMGPMQSLRRLSAPWTSIALIMFCVLAVPAWAARKCPDGVTSTFNLTHRGNFKLTRLP